MPSPPKPWNITPLAKKGADLPSRKIHLDYHNSRHISQVGQDFDARDFIDVLAEAEVDSIVVFAKDMHGYCYYPSVIGPVHPGLKRDLLGEQVSACRAAGIKVYAYYCSLWDHFLAVTHPEWLSITRQGETYLPKEGEAPSWTGLCASNRGLVDLIKGHMKEILTGYKVDGIWFDMPIPRDSECFCPLCLATIRDEGGDPSCTATQRRFQQKLHISFLAELAELAEKLRPGCQVDFNNQPSFGLTERVHLMDSVDIEALPTAEWGYDYFPTLARYVRTLGVPVYGMTGRFHKSWGDFGGLKTAHQLTSECFGIVALGAKCDIGDQMPPCGVLDKEVYQNIGAAYQALADLEPCLAGSIPVTEAVLVSEGLPLDSMATPSICGAVKALAELSIQFDVMESGQAWEERGLCLFVNPSLELADRIDAYLAQGGKAILLGGELLTKWGSELSEFDVSYGICAGRYEGAIYGPASSWATSGEVIAWLGEPEFNRSGAAYTSHMHGPLAKKTERAVAEERDGLGLIGFDLGLLYFETGYVFYRKLLATMLSILLPSPMVSCPQGSAIQANIAWKAETQEWLVHVFDATMARPTPGHPPFYEPGPARAGVQVNLGLGELQGRARLMRQGTEVQVQDGHLTLPLLDRYELVVISAKESPFK